MDLAEARRYTRRLPNMVADTDYFPFAGGLNLVDTPLAVRPGQLLACKNYEPGARGGYERLNGYERFDGRLKPSEAHYHVLAFHSGTPARYPFPGQTVNGASSGATGVMLAPPIHSDGTGSLILGRVTGTFEDEESLRVGASVFGLANGPDVDNSALNDEDDAAYKALAIADARAQIGKVPGAGPIRGVAVYNGITYAFRDTTDTPPVGAIYKSSASGWTELDLGRRLNFTAGTAEIVAGEDLTDGTATAVVRRVVVQSGDWSTHDAAGYLMLADVEDEFSDGLTLTSDAGSATASGADVPFTLPAGGHYEFRVRNFYGHAGTKRLYAVNGVGPALELQDNPSFVCPLLTGMTTDLPNHLAIHNEVLWLSFPGGSVQKSGAGDPGSWRVVTGAAELGVGDEVTGFLEEIADALFVFSRNSTKVITGNEADGYNMKNFGFETGAYPSTLQRMGKGIYLDDRGFTLLSAAQEYGNFAANSISVLIAPLVRELAHSVTTSVVSRSANKVRYFFEDGRFLTVGFIGEKVAGFTTSDYGLPVRCAFSGEDANGFELLMFGSDDGYVYEADKGTSFDGGAIQAFLRLVFHHSKTPSRIKRYRKADIDVATKGPTSLRATVDYSYADPSSSGEPVKDVTMLGGGGFWDISKWNEFRWSAGVQATASLKLEGSGFNIGLLFSSESAVEESHLLNGVTFHLSPRRLNRSTA